MELTYWKPDHLVVFEDFLLRRIFHHSHLHSIAGSAEQASSFIPNGIAEEPARPQNCRVAISKVHDHSHWALRSDWSVVRSPLSKYEAWRKIEHPGQVLSRKLILVRGRGLR